jgi:hypothetical protein
VIESALQQQRWKVGEQLVDTAGTELQAEELRGQFRQLVGFVHDHGVRGWQDVAPTFFLESEVGQQQVMIDHHKLSVRGTATRRKHMASRVLGAACTRAAVARRGNALAQRMAIRQLRKFRQVAFARDLRPALHAGSKRTRFISLERKLPRQTLQAFAAQVVGTSLQQCHGGRATEGTAQ